MTDSILYRLQTDVAAILAFVPGLSGANVLIDDTADIETRVLKALGTITPVSGKIGMVCIVMQPEVTGSEKNLPGTVIQIKMDVQVIEQVTLNRGTGGTLIRSDAAALRVLGALHLANLGDVLLYSDKDAISPLPAKPGFQSHLVTVHARLDGIPLPAKCADVSATVVNGSLVLACSTPLSGVWYSTDGTFPSPANTGSIVYIYPLALSVPALKRRAAGATTSGDGTAFHFSNLTYAGTYNGKPQYTDSGLLWDGGTWGSTTLQALYYDTVTTRWYIQKYGATTAARYLAYCANPADLPDGLTLANASPGSGSVLISTRDSVTEVGTEIRAVAFADGYNPGNVIGVTITP